MRGMSRTESVWWKILGVLLVLLGAVLLVGPHITYNTKEKLPNTSYYADREKTLVIPRAIGVVVIAGGVLAIVLTSKRS